jgi:hypothetical protein
MASENTTADWQPIETAPRDGNEVKVLVEVTAHWQKSHPALLLGEGWKLDLDSAQAKKWKPL